MAEVSFSIETNLIDHIGLAMYGSVNKAICELVANSYDADASIVRITIPDPIKEDSTIIIDDNGDGMDKKEIIDSYMHLGGSVKRSKRERTKKYRRKILGSKGIGKLAGLGVANKMCLVTKKNRKKITLDINRNLLDVPGITLDKVKFPLIEEESTEESGTIIYLKELLPHVSSITAEELKRDLVRQFGTPKHWEVYVNGERYGAEDILGKKIYINEIIEGCGEVKGLIVVASKEKEMKTPGIVTRARGRAILEPTFFDINKPGVGGHQFRVIDRIYGDIEASFFDPEKPTQRFDRFAISTDREGVNINNPKFILYKSWVEKKVRDIARNIERELESERKKNIEERLQKYPPSVQKYVREAFQKIDFSQMSEKEVQSSLDAVVKLLESTEMREILQKLKETDPHDLQKMATLLHEWGVYEIVMISEMIKGRLEVLSKFSLLVSDLTTLEYRDIHKLLEANMWILNDNYKLYSSNKTFNTILNSELDKKYKKDKTKRPDLIVKTLAKQFVIIELKKPDYTISSADLPQVLDYLKILKKHNPNTNTIDCYLIGGKYDEDMEKILTMEGTRILITSYSEMMADSEFRYREILTVFNKE